jgi:hypothetical protein
MAASVAVVLGTQLLLLAYHEEDGMAEIAPPGGTAAWPYLVFCAGLAFATPLGLYRGVVVAFRGVRSPARRGAVAGLAVALWSNAVAAALPYVGAYPSLPALLAAHGLCGDHPWRGTFWLVLVLANVLLWTAGATILSWTYSWMRRKGWIPN